MKTLKTTIALLGIIGLFGFASVAKAAPYDWFCMLVNPTPPGGNSVTFVPSTGANTFLMFDGGTKRCTGGILGSRFSLAGGIVDIDLTNQPESNIINLISDLAAKQDWSQSLADISTLPSVSSDMLGLIGSATTQDAVDAMNLETADISDFTWDLSSYNNDAGFLTSVPAQSFASLTGKPTTLSGYGITDAYPLTGNPSNFLTGITSGQVTGALGFTPYNATNPSNYIDQSGARSAISLTTTGTSGAATYNSSTGVLNIPNYAPGTGTVTSVGLSSSDFSVSGSPVTSSGTITANLNNSGVSAGTYDTVTVNAKGIVTAGQAKSQSMVTRSFNSSFQPSTTRPSVVRYNIQIASSISLSGVNAGSIFLEISPDNSTWTTIGQTTNSQGGGLVVGLSLTQTIANQLTADVPAGWYVRLRTSATSGTPTFTYLSGQETLN